MSLTDCTDHPKCWKNDGHEGYCTDAENNRLQPQVTIRRSESVVLDLDKQGVEIATGYRGVGVFMTILGGRGNRIVTVALPRGKADELARLLRLAAAASRSNEAAS